jgi:tetratricopeptide (TPR) repeat protein
VPEDAVVLALRAAVERADAASLRFALGSHLLRTHRAVDALAEAEAGLRLEPANRELLALAIDAAVESGDAAKAIAYRLASGAGAEASWVVAPVEDTPAKGSREGAPFLRVVASEGAIVDDGPRTITFADVGGMEDVKQRLATRGTEWAHALRAQALFRTDRPEDALAFVDEALKLAPDLPQRHRQRAYILAKLGRADDAWSEAARARELAPRDALSHDVIGDLSLAAKQYVAAEEAWREALRIDPTSAMRLSNMGAALARQGRRDEAREAFRHAIRMDPSLEVSKRNLHENVSATLGKGARWRRRSRGRAQVLWGQRGEVRDPRQRGPGSDGGVGPQRARGPPLDRAGPRARRARGQGGAGPIWWRDDCGVSECAPRDQRTPRST